MIKEGYITALGTPLDDRGRLIPHSFRAHIEDQVDAGCGAFLVMGTMGNEVFIRNSEYRRVAAEAASAAAGRVPVLVGVMDNSAGRVLDRIEELRDLPIQGVVATAPFYLTATQQEIISFFSMIGRKSSFPLYLYDLPGVTKTKVQTDTALKLMNQDSIAGIKSGDLLTCRDLHFHPDRKPDFTVMYSGLDTFDAAYGYGIRRNLDGMFCCTPKINKDMYRALEQGDAVKGREELKKILRLRDLFAGMGIFTGFTAAMNLLGYEGNFAPDYMKHPGEEEREIVRSCMREIGLL
ncbi:MAG: dihydrodipicolinate synthase family protein [Spirochaetia bacterium]